ncbi:MAG: 50S ribosomal protein L25 [Anaerolineae bacterium]|nr:50S ribosomal protein L25 [Anaerolineae bacterium]
MAESIVLEATKRTISGKQVKTLRAEGLIPGILYGPELEAVPLQLEWVELRPVLRKAGGSQLIELTVGDQTYNALVRSVQRAPVKGDVLHIDFLRVRMNVAIRTEVPIVLVGEALTLEDIGGALNQEIVSVEVECMPANLPAEIRVDISSLAEIGAVIAASDLPELDGVTYHIERDDVIVSTAYLQRPEEVEEVEEELLEEEVEPEVISRREDEEGDEEAEM